MTGVTPGLQNPTRTPTLQKPYPRKGYGFLEGRGTGWAGVSGVRVTRGVKRRGRIIDMYIVGAKSNPKGSLIPYLLAPIKRTQPHHVLSLSNGYNYDATNGTATYCHHPCMIFLICLAYRTDSVSSCAFTSNLKLQMVINIACNK